MASDKDSKLKALQLTLDRLDKTYGKGTVMKMGDSVHEAVESISTGSIGLDFALGVGGYPRGRVVEIYGPESSGKTTLTLHAIAECQKAGGIADKLKHLLSGHLLKIYDEALHHHISIHLLQFLPEDH